MIPMVTPEEMAAIDAAAPEPVEVLIERAGAAVARAALALLGGGYGRRIAVVAGPGNNGNDGRSAARRLRARGAQVVEYDARDAPARLPAVDLVIDAAYGTGLRRPYTAPSAQPGTPVLAVDIPSGVDGLTGVLCGAPAAADATITFAALKPGLVFPPGRELCGEISIADIGLDVSRARAHLIEATDLERIGPRPVDAHKWQRACWVIGGSPGMTGAPQLAAAAAARAGAGYVRLSVPGADLASDLTPIEAVHVPVGPDLTIAADELARVRSVVFGPGLGRSAAITDAARRFVAGASVPLVIDGDGLTALAERAAGAIAQRSYPTILTPHDGEYRALTGKPPEADRCDAARRLARTTGAIVLLKGPTTVIAHPGGRVLLSVAGDARLASAGTGDVLAGTIGGLLAHGLDAFWAAALGAFVHGTAALTSAQAFGLVAGDLVAAIGLVLARRGEVGA